MTKYTDHIYMTIYAIFITYNILLIEVMNNKLYDF